MKVVNCSESSRQYRNSSKKVGAFLRRRHDGRYVNPFQSARKTLFPAIPKPNLLYKAEQKRRQQRKVYLETFNEIETVSQRLSRG